MSSLVPIGEAFVRQLDRLEAETPGKFYPIGVLEGMMRSEEITLPDEISMIQFLELLQKWDWVESNGDGFETENQFFRITAKGQYRSAASVNYVEQFEEAFNSLPDLPIEHKAEKGTFGNGAYGAGPFGSSTSLNSDMGSFDSESWTGIPKTGVLSEAATTRLKAALANVDDAVSHSQASNEEKAQARAYVIAIQALADAPEPPADLIWEMITRANQLSGIASFFLSLIALYTTVLQ